MPDAPEVLLITGGSRGIGAALAKGFAAEGAHVILTARTIGGLEEVDDEIQAAGGGATLVEMDLQDYPAIDRLGGSIYERWGKLDILIAQASGLAYACLFECRLPSGRAPRSRSQATVAEEPPRTAMAIGGTELL